MMSKGHLLKCCAAFLMLVSVAFAQGGELHFCIKADPKTFNPVAVSDDWSEVIRYLTGGVLMRVNRQTQQLEPELATSWKVSNAGRTITVTLRPKMYFSDGTPFTADDVAFTMEQLMDPNLHSVTGDAFRSGSGSVTTKVLAPNKISITFPAAIAGLDKLFDQVAMMSAKSPKKEMAVLGPFYVADYKSGSYVYLRKNNNYWKKDSAGRKLPLLDAIKIDIQPNRDIELLRFRRGELDLINTLDADFYDKLAEAAPNMIRDAGPSLDSEQFWFNQAPTAPIPAYKREWFKSRNFRVAISRAINRDDIARIVYGGHAKPAFGPASPANKFWFNSKLKPLVYDIGTAQRLLAADGFRMTNSTMRDKQGNAVEFSIVVSATAKARQRIAAMIQQDLGKIGIKVNVVALDFPSLVDRITNSYNYESAVLGFINTEMDPNSQMTVWLSSGENHAWWPKQQKPATAWEIEMDKLMQAQTQSPEVKARKKAWDRVQEIVQEQQPMIYLVNKNALSAVSSNVVNASPVALRPQTYWNVDQLFVKGGERSGQ